MSARGSVLLGGADRFLNAQTCIALLAITVIFILTLWYSRRFRSTANPQKGKASECIDSRPLQEPGEEAAVTAALPRMLPLTILYASTTGTARGFASVMAKELFAMNISGFHFRVKTCDAATYDPDTLEQEGLLLILYPTWTGGTAAPSAVALSAHVHDLATDFRVSKDSLKNLRYAVFGLGNREYGRDWCRAAHDLDADLAALSARALVPLGCGDDSADQQRSFRGWLDSLWPALCEVYAAEMGVTEALRARDGEAGDGGSCSGCGGVSSAASYKVARSWEEEEAAAGARLGRGDAPGLRNRKGGGGGGGGGGCSNPGCACGTSAPSGGGGDSGAAAAQEDDRPYVAPDGSIVTRRQWRKARKAEREAAAAAAASALRRSAAAAARKAGPESGGGAAASAKGALPAAPLPSSVSAASDSDEEGEGAGGAAAASYAAAAEAAAAAVDSDDDSDNDEGGDGPGFVDEEDRLNDLMLAEADGVAAYDSGLDDDDEAPGATAAAPAARKAASSDVDLEDLGTALAAAAAGEESGDAASRPPPREMVTPAQRMALTKENYQIIGSHSAVKMCRWTKASLRGRGCCYKMTFYGIRSYLCMEATPSLACANKCVFCWRHHKNPVGREWRWVVDDPAMIVSESVRKHQRLVKQLRGLPGLRLDRWAEAFTVRHCALSLVGEPIMYPHINALVRLLHERRISTFLVTNAQFPESIASLGPVTQLYVSIDAATKDTLKAIDRPLFADFYERFLGSLDALRAKQQRTVYRLTLVKGGNMDELADYVALVHRGCPDLIEVKGVTWCGTSPGSTLTMQNVPWHHEVKAFCERLAESLGSGYALACEHEHSCCVLIAKTQFRIAGRWHTHIDYERFSELVSRFYSTGEPFTTLDYVAPTPDWCLYGSPEHGFDPRELRWRRNKSGQVKEIEYKSSESGCG